MRKTRLVNNSIFNYIASVLSGAGYDNVNLYDSYPNVDKPEFMDNLPAVSVSVGERISGTDYEMGNTEQETERVCMIDIFTEARLDGQMADLGDLIKDSLRSIQIDLMDYNPATPISIGEIRFEDVSSSVVGAIPRIFNQLVITFSAVTYE